MGSNEQFFFTSTAFFVHGLALLDLVRLKGLVSKINVRNDAFRAYQR